MHTVLPLVKTKIIMWKREEKYGTLGAETMEQS